MFCFITLNSADLCTGLTLTVIDNITCAQPPVKRLESPKFKIAFWSVPPLFTAKMQLSGQNSTLCLAATVSSGKKSSRDEDYGDETRWINFFLSQLISLIPTVITDK